MGCSNPNHSAGLHFEHADYALHEAKRQGRNPIVNYEDIVSSIKNRDDDIELFQSCFKLQPVFVTGLSSLLQESVC